MSSRDDYPYPEDEFDLLGADRTPQGVHRAPLPRWRQWLPFLIVIVLAPTLALIAVRVLDGGGTPSGDGTTSAATSDTTVEPTADPTTTVDPTADPTETPSQETPAADLDYSTTVWVLNGSGVSGLAAQTVSVLEADGWQDANAADYSSSLPTATTIFYDNPDQAAEAEAIGQLLGIDALSENSDAADGDIVIVLRSGFENP